MKKQRLAGVFLAILTAAFLLGAIPAPARENSRAGEEKAHPASVDIARLTGYDFQSEFLGSGDPQMYLYLNGLGEMIDSGRKIRNVGTLTAAAQLLYLAETSTGRKSARMNSALLLIEASELAKTQKNARVLALVVKAWESLDNKEMANKYSKAARVAIAEKKDPRAKPGAVRYINNTQSRWITVYLDGVYQGMVGPGKALSAFGVYPGRTTLLGRDYSSGLEWGPKINVTEGGDVYEWELWD